MDFYNQAMQLTFLINDVAVITGYAFLYKAFVKFHKHAEAKAGGGGGGQGSAVGGYVLLFCAAALIGLPYFIKVAEAAFWGQSLPMPINGSFATLFVEKNVIMLLRVFGVGMVVAGLAKLAKAGSDQGGGQQQHFGKAIMTLIIGLILIHIVQFTSIIGAIVMGAGSQ